MTMQTTSLPFQVAGANALPQRANALPGAAADGGKAFGDTLSREIAQRQAMPQQPMAPAPAAQPNKPAGSAAASRCACARTSSRSFIDTAAYARRAMLVMLVVSKR